MGIISVILIAGLAVGSFAYAGFLELQARKKSARK